MVSLVSTQSFRDPETVAEKQDAGDYVVLVTPEFMLNGVPTRAVLDGHHSLAAAIADGVDPVLQEIGAGDSGGRTKPVLDACSCKPLESGKSIENLEHKRQGVDAIVREWVLSMAGSQPDAQIEVIDRLGIDGAVDHLLGEMGRDIADRGDVIQAMSDYRAGLDEEQGEADGSTDVDAGKATGARLLYT